MLLQFSFNLKVEVQPIWFYSKSGLLLWKAAPSSSGLRVAPTDGAYAIGRGVWTPDSNTGW